jgi:hypothetical protein
MRKITLDVIDTCPMKDGKDVFLISDTLSGFADKAATVPTENHNRKECKKGNDWTGGMSYDDSVRFTRDGDISGVAASDEWLKKFESLTPTRQAWARVDSVAGYAPNVPAVLMGHPLSMRRRVRVSSAIAPLAVCVDLVSSAGIKASTLQKRGALILALVRALSAIRPVELWCGGSSLPAGQKSTVHAWWRMDTTPLDLARAAHVMTSTAVSRGMVYGVVSNEVGDSGWLQWPYGNHTWSRANMRPVLSRVIGSDDMLCIAAPHMEDDLVNKPEQWFDAMLKEYGGIDHEA